MILPRSLKKWIALFRGDVAPILILLTTVFGFWFGLTPGWYGIHVALIVLVLILNVHIGLFIMFAGIGKALSFAAAPALYHTGVFVQDRLPDLLSTLSRIPIVGITDFSRMAVAGAALLGPAVGLILGLFLALSVSGFRRTWLRLEDGSDRLRRWRQKAWIRFLDRVLIGKSAADARTALTRRARLIRWPGVILSALIIGGAAVAANYRSDAALTDHAAASLTRVNRAEVNVERIELATARGRVVVVGLQVTDPDKPTHNRIAVGELTAEVSWWHLSLGRVMMDQVKLSNVAFDGPRGSAGAVSDPRKPADDRDVAFDPGAFGLPDISPDTLESLFSKREEVRDWLKTIEQYLPEFDEEPQAEATGPPEHYLGYLTARARNTPTPRILVRELALTDVHIPVELIGTSDLVCRNLSDAPRGAGLPVSIQLTSQGRSTSAAVTCDFSTPECAVRIEASIDDIDLKRLQESLNPNNPVVLEGGTASAEFSGTIVRGSIDVAIRVRTKGLKTRIAGGGVLGLDSQVTAEAFKMLENLDTTLRLVGPIANPRLVFDSSALTASMRDALVKAGKEQLVGRMDALLGDKLPDGVPRPGDLLNKPENLGEAAKDALGGLLNRNLGGDEKKKKDKP